MACDKFIQWLEDDFAPWIERVLEPVPFIFINFLLVVVFVFEFFIVLPNEIALRGIVVGTGLAAIGVYFFVNIFYHLYKTAFTDPGRVPKDNRSPSCDKCVNHKPYGSHHCRTCDKCVLRMDHHCLFIGACIGLYNHRHFVQFLAFLGFGCVYALFAGIYSLWYNVIWRSREYAYCNMVEDSVLCAVRGAHLPFITIVFGNAICLFGAILGLSMFVWQAFLVSDGMTAIQCRKEGKGDMPSWQIFKDMNWAKKNWKEFLGIAKSNESFLTRVLLPSGHKPYYAEEYTLGKV